MKSTDDVTGVGTCLDRETRSRWSLLALAIGTFAIGTTEFGPMGFLPSIASGLGVSIPQAGQIISAYALGVTISAPIATLAIRRLRARNSLILAMSVFIAGNLLSAIAPNYGTLLVARLITSFNHGAFIGLGSIVAVNLVPKERRASAIATMFMGLTIANIGGVPAASWIAQQVGWRVSFAGTAALGGIALVVLGLALPEGEAGEPVSVQREWRVLTSPAVLIAIATSMTGSASMFTFYTYIAPVLLHMIGASERFLILSLMLVGVGFTLGNSLGGRLADWSLTGATRLILGALTLVLLVLPLLLRSQVGAAIGLLAFGATSFAIVSPMQTRVMHAASEAPHLAASLNVSAFNLGNALGAIIGGGVISLGFSYAVVPIAAAFVAAASLALTLFSWTPKEHAALGGPGVGSRLKD